MMYGSSGSGQNSPCGMYLNFISWTHKVEVLCNTACLLKKPELKRRSKDFTNILRNSREQHHEKTAEAGLKKKILYQRNGEGNLFSKFALCNFLIFIFN